MDSSITIANMDNYTHQVTDRNGVNQALLVNSDTNAIFIPHGKLATVTGDWTIELWLKTSAPAPFTSQNIIYIMQNDEMQNFVGIYISENKRLVIEILEFEFQSSTTFDDYFDVWTRVALSYDSVAEIAQFFVNEVPFADPIEISGMGFSNLNTDIEIGGIYGNSKKIQGSIAEFSIYNTKLSSPYKPYKENAQALNSLIELNETCPGGTSEWSIGPEDKRTCIANSCSARLRQLVNFMDRNFSVNAEFKNASETTWGDAIQFEHSLSDLACGSGASEECFTSQCFQEVFVHLENSLAVSQIPQDSMVGNPSMEITQSDYNNSTLNTKCTTVSTDEITCYYMIGINFSGTYFDKGSLLATHKFTVSYKKVAGEDTLIAEITDQQMGAQTTTQNSIENALFENVAQSLNGTLEWTSGAAPAQIILGQQLDFTLKADVANQERDFKNGTLSLELVFQSNGSDVVIPASIIADSDTYVNDGNTTLGAVRSITFSFQPYVLGTYTIRAGATLKSLAARLLLEGEFEKVGQEIQITVVDQKQLEYSYYNIMQVLMVLSGILALVLVYQYQQDKKKSQNKYSQYQSTSNEEKI